MAVNRGIVGLLLLLGSTAHANEADDIIHRLVGEAQAYAVTRNPAGLSRTLFEIAEALPGASDDGVAAVNELSRYLASPAAVTPRRDATPTLVPKPADPPPQPIERPPAQQPGPTATEPGAEARQAPPPQGPPASAPTLPIPASPATAVTPQASPALLELLLRQGAAALGRGDISGARRFYQRGADAGCALCAEGMAQTFDAEQLSRIGAIGIRPDPAQAEAWRARTRQLMQAGKP